MNIIDTLADLDAKATPGPWWVQEVPGSCPYLAHWVEVAGERLRGEAVSEALDELDAAEETKL